MSRTRRFPLDAPLSLPLTLRLATIWGAQSWQKVDRTGGWLAQRTEEGPATVQMVHQGDFVEARSWGPGAELIMERVPEIIGLSDPGVAAITPHHPALHHLRKRLRGYRMGRVGQVFPSLVSVALAQKVTGRNSAAVLHRLARAWGERAPGPRTDLFLLPLPEELVERPYYLWHELGIEAHRAELVRRISKRAARLEEAATMAGPEARVHLQHLRGIGPWTSAVVVGGALGDPDAVPEADYHLPNWVSWNLAQEPRGSDARMLELLEPYAGRRGQVVRMLKGGGSAPPTYGPKTEVRDIRDL